MARGVTAIGCPNLHGVTIKSKSEGTGMLMSTAFLIDVKIVL